jgi:sucrose-6F-phosphate phosphohydrolase
MCGRLTSDQKLLVSDIDGTLLRDGEPTPGLATLRTILEAHRDQVQLVYATGRTLVSTRDLIKLDVLPEADAIASLVGTEVWLPPWQEPDTAFGKMVSVDWDRAAVQGVIEQFAAVTRQSQEFLTEHKLSYYLEDASVAQAIEQELRLNGLAARVVYSCGLFLDVLPARAGKRRAVEFIRQQWGIPQSNVLACGDSGNDLDMLLDPRFQGVAVGNAEKELVAQDETDSFQLAHLPFAAGVLEGTEVFDFWPAEK